MGELRLLVSIWLSDAGFRMGTHNQRDYVDARGIVARHLESIGLDTELDPEAYEIAVRYVADYVGV